MSPSDETSAPRNPARGTGLVVVLALAAAAVAGVVIWHSFDRPQATAVLPDVVAPEEFRPAVAAIPATVRFSDVTDEAGIRFRHANGARGKKLLPETMGGGCAFIDFDNDGDQDLLFVNSAQWPEDRDTQEGASLPVQALYENDGKGRFRDASAETGLAVTFYGMGAAIGDIDNDGWDDIFFTAVGGDRLFRNMEGKRFVEITEEAGITNDDPNRWSTSAAFLDYDLDGRLDLFVCTYIEWSPELDLAQGFQITGIGRAYGPPQNFAGAFPKLYRNRGGRFEDVSAAAGIQVRNPHTGKPLAKALGVAVHDLDSDGYPDIAVANDTVQNLLFRNRGDGTFEEIGFEAGLAFDASGKTRGAMGIDWQEVAEDGTQAVVIGNFANEITALYKSQLPGKFPFTDDAIIEGIGNPSRKYMKFGVFFFDFDLDGRLDIFEANGHLEEEIETVQREQTYAQPAQLFWNAGPGGERGFEVAGAEHVGPDLFQPVVGRGCAYGDIDGDGDLDIVLVSNGGRGKLFRNDGGDANGWLRIELEGTRANRNAFGARVEAKVGGRTLRATLASGRSYLSQCEQVITFGLEAYSRAEAVRITWPGEKDPQELGTLPGRTVHKVKQP